MQINTDGIKYKLINLNKLSMNMNFLIKNQCLK